MKRLLVTGATGFVGGHLLPLLADLSTKIVTRTSSGGLEGYYESVIVDDINEKTEWSDALSGIDCVVHMAGRVHIMKPTHEDHLRFHQTNVLGTERLAQASIASGVKRFIFLSSIKVNGELTEGEPFRASDQPNPSDDYGLSKWQAEQRLFDVAKSKMEVIVIRPPLVYGPGVRANFLSLMSYVRKGIPLPLGAVRNMRSMVSVWNLCDLIQLTINRPSIDSGVLLVSDGEDISTPHLIRTLAHAMGRSAKLLPVPVSVLKLSGALIGKQAQVARLCGSLRLDISDTKRRLGWSPPVRVEEGLARTARWYWNQVSESDN